MKTSLAKIVSTVGLLSLTSALHSLDLSPAVVLERGPHHRVWQRMVDRVRADRSIAKASSVYIELATGLHYLKNGQWVETKEEIEVFEGGAIARQGPHQVIWMPNINAAGAVDLLTADNKRFRSHILGLAYTDTASGKAVMIAEIRDSIGQLIAPNQIVYADAFTDIKADVRYTYTKAGLEQDIILREEPPSPLVYGLPLETTLLEIYTEFVESPAPHKKVNVVRREHDPAVRAAMVEPDAVDEMLDFGATFIGGGRAFPLEDAGVAEEGDAVPVRKVWEQRERRQFLIEKVDYAAIQPHLAALPRTAALSNPKPGIKTSIAPLKHGALLSQFSRRPQRARNEQRVQVASVTPKSRGFVLDYIQMGNSSNFRFRGDTTYLVSGAFTLSGTTTFEGGTVIKYTNSVANRLLLTGPIDCRTDAFHPATFTSMHDNSIGEIIAGSTGNPGTNNYNFTRDIEFNSSGTLFDVHDVRVRYTVRAIVLTDGELELSNAQLGFAGQGIYNIGNKFLKFRNVLFHNLDQALLLSSGYTNNHGENCTFHKIKDLANAGSMRLTNCLIISVTNNVHLYSGSNVYTNVSDTGIFQTVGSATRYLAADSPHRNAGTTNINAALLANLKKKTTYPPLVVSSITVDTTLAPQAQRDYDLPDLGYHYDPLDYVIHQIGLTNVTLTVTPGSSIGVYGSSGEYGVFLMDGAQLLCDGTADNLCRFVRYNLVQEQADTTWANSSMGTTVETPLNWVGEVAPLARFRFTQWAMPAAGAEHFNGTWLIMPRTEFRDCQFLGGRVFSDLPSLAITNCLFDRVELTAYEGTNDYHNNLFYGGKVTVVVSPGVHTFTDNLFDKTIIDQWGSPTHSHNGYFVNSNRLSPNSATDVILTNILYETAALGRFYVPTNSPLLNTGSVASAASVGLYHYTMTTDQVKETNSIVDIGFHYVAVNGSGRPVDTDMDGIPDYVEDVNGNGSVDSGETNWNGANDFGFVIKITRPSKTGGLP